MYALVSIDNMFGKYHVKVFPTIESAHKAMSDEFYRNAEEDDIEIVDGRCWIEEREAYDTPDGSGWEWRIVEVEEG